MFGLFAEISARQRDLLIVEVRPIIFRKNLANYGGAGGEMNKGRDNCSGFEP